MFYMKEAGRSAVAIPDYKDTQLLENLGLQALSNLSKTDNGLQNTIRRLVNGGYIPEGNY